MNKKEKFLVFPNITDALFPYKVYREYSELKRDKDTEVLRILVGGFRELEDAELFVKAKIEQTQKSYVIEHTKQETE